MSEQQNAEIGNQENSNSRENLQSKIETLTTQKNNLPAEVGGMSTNSLGSKIDNFIDILNDIIEQSGDAGSRQSLINDIAAYGVTIRANDFTLDQLVNILAALKTMADRLFEMARNCPCADISNFDSSTSLFHKAYSHEPLVMWWNSNDDFASVERYQNTQIATLVPNTFSTEIKDEQTGEITRQEYPDEIIQRIIIHELTHVFHNNLIPVQGLATDYDFSNDNVQVATGFRGNILITIPRIEIGAGDELEVFNNMVIEVSADTPFAVIDYLVTTQGYWSGLGFDDGRYREEGVYTPIEANNDETVVVLTNFIYQQYKGATSCVDTNGDEDCDFEHLVDLNGRCLRDNQGNCIPPSGNHSGKKYVRLPGTYLRSNFDASIIEDPIIRNYFSNESGETSLPHPQEGFGDALTYHIIEGIDGDNIGNSPRGQFIVDNFCRWICSLIHNGE